MITPISINRQNINFQARAPKGSNMREKVSKGAGFIKRNIFRVNRKISNSFVKPKEVHDVIEKGNTISDLQMLLYLFKKK